MSTETKLYNFQDVIDESTDPLDAVEALMMAQNWNFTREDNQINIEVRGQYGAYRIFFIHEDDMHAMQFCVQYDFTIHDDHHLEATQTLAKVNEKLWLGHYEIPSDSNIPTFRYTMLLTGMSGANANAQFGEIIEVALTQCERFYTAFHLLANGHDMNDKTMPLALMETKGAA